MANRSRASNFFTAILCIAMVAMCISAVVAQSGRRVPKSTPAPVKTPEPTPTPSVKEPTKAARIFVVGIARYEGFAQLPLYAAAGVLRTLTDRLSGAPSVQATMVKGQMSRSDAISRAESGLEAYVVWIQLRPETMGEDDDDNLTNLYIEYSVFAPRTAKLTTHGKVYQPRRHNKVLAKRGSVYGDDLLNQAAQEAADRILAALKLPSRPIPG